MTISIPYLPRRQIGQLLFMIAGFSCCGVATSADSLPAEPSSGKNVKLQKLKDRASELAMQAMGMLGIHYKHGGSDPQNGLDCSGLVRYVYKEAWGADLPRTSLEISHLGEIVKTEDLQPGDLVFFNTLKRGFSHVGIYLGEHKFIHSPSAGGQVRIESMEVSYWKKRFDGARRISDPQKLTLVAPVIELSTPVLNF